MAYIPKLFAVWIPATANNRPDDGEQVVFHLKSEDKTEWHSGVYSDTEQLIRIKHAESIYYVVPFEPGAVDYWMRIPSL